VVRETGSACPQCADGGRITSREPMYGPKRATFGKKANAARPRISTRYRCDRGHEWEEPFQPSKPTGNRG
jgi:hypothetical protein